MRPRGRALAALGAALLLAAACGDDDGADDAASVPLRLDQVQVLASHNSYHLEGAPELLDAVRAFAPDLVQTLEYSHPTLTDQLDAGLRGLELDVFADAEGGRYAHPKAVDRFGLDPVDPSMEDPGFKVFHMQEVDYRSSCPTLTVCLTEVRDWSDDHPDHLPIVIQLEAKDGFVLDVLGLGFVQPTPVTSETFTALEAEIRSVLPEEDLIVPADVQGDSPTLRAAVEEAGWPLVDDLRGKVLFVLDDDGLKRQSYRQLHPDTRERLLFVSAQPPDDDAAYAIVNDPEEDGARIAELVRAGFLVRTRADADTVEAREGTRTRAAAAMVSGAQVVTTDYEVEDPRYPGYVVTLPGGRTARCNPLTAPTECRSADVAKG